MVSKDYKVGLSTFESRGKKEIIGSKNEYTDEKTLNSAAFCHNKFTQLPLSRHLKHCIPPVNWSFELTRHCQVPTHIVPIYRRIVALAGNSVNELWLVTLVHGYI